MATTGLLAFCNYLEHTALNATIQDQFWIVPTMQSVHILAIAAVLISTLLIDFRILGIHGKDESVATVSKRYSHIVWLALPILLITGCIMIVGEPARSLTNPAFQIKMVLLIAVILITVILQRKCQAANSFTHLGKSTHILAMLSLVAWMGIVAAGRWIAYA
ncbi:DUF6644 family protein [Polynucleobacter sp. UK-Kesae-W10]|uniref:DUF6644 family protein n=1 Tax=Polynucleobacter sp. UK-Kesae-W10 TaxID=1819738 RepID=UPI001C0BC623|nr:DUF6644 family protein [Polynucleobacter sp. UK-Kesae-W10]MBU3577270.1 hypothetical protein [Polynucleobacter sp. UK-Kesae-W10]